MEIVSVPQLPPGARPVVRSNAGAATLYTVAAGDRLHIYAAWISAAGTITASALVNDSGTRTILGAVGTFSGMDVQVPATATVNLTGGTGGFVGYIMPAIG